METRAFGIKLIESVTGGSNYDHSLRGLLILEDELDVLKWKAFWKHSKEGGEKLKDQLTTIVESLEGGEKLKDQLITIVESLEGGEKLKDQLTTIVESLEGGEKLKDQLTTIVESLELMRAQSKDELKNETKNS